MMMTLEKNPCSLITNAVVWASLMIATALILAGSNVTSERQFFLIMLQIAGWYSINRLLHKHSDSFKSEWACIRDRFSK
jgi:hypothetical protein